MDATTVNRTVLIVDDEAGVRKAIARSLRPTGVHILEADSAPAALWMIEAEPGIGVVISDYGMPGMSGTDFLREMQNRHPDVIRIMLTARTDMDALVDAVNLGAVYKFLVKPWEADDLRAAVEEGFRTYGLAAENRRLQEDLRQANARLQELNADLEERVREKARELTQASLHDAVTGLPNRTLLCDRLAQLLHRARRDRGTVAVFLFDIERFKLINEALGHSTGDEVLRMVAQRLTAYVRETDTIARVNSDKFCLVLHKGETEEGVTAVAARILETMQQPFTVAGHEVFLTGSIGISLFPNDAADVDTLLKHAEAALNHLRAGGGSGVEFYSREISARAARRLSLETELRHALERSEFCLYYQPRADLAGPRLTGVEALLRWRHPQRGLIQPAEFVPLLEGTGLIEPVGEWVLTEASAAATRLARAGYPLCVAVNLSTRQFHQPDLAERIAGALAAGGIDPTNRQIEVEITESLLMQDVDKAQRTLGRLHDLGIRIALDDFGTGYSSLSYLTRFPIDYIKIDRSFVLGVADGTDAGAIVQAIIAMAHSLGKSVIAEGVETAEQLRALSALDCDELQGYLLAPPLPETDLLDLLGKGDTSLLAPLTDTLATSRDGERRIQDRPDSSGGTVP